MTILHQSLFSKKQALSDWEMAQEGNNWKLQWLQKPEAKNWLRSGLVQEGQAVERILQMGKEYNFPVLLVVYPYPVMMAHSWLDNEHTRYWKKVALKNSVALADLSSEFVEKGAEPKETYKKYFIPGDFHWNNEGNNLVARALVPRIMEKLASP